VKRILSMMLSFIFLLCCIQTLGNYLVQEMRMLHNAPEVEIQHREEVTTYKVLRLEPREYYTVHLGTYDELMACQEKIDQLAGLGYRPFVAKEFPYKIRIGCFALEEQLDKLPQELLLVGQDVYLEKCLHNQHSLKFREDDAFAREHLSSLVAGYDILLQHSLNMFQSWQADIYTEELWRQMITQLQEEGNNLLEQVQLAAQNCPASIYSRLFDLHEVTENYLESLVKIAEFPENSTVWSAQSYLLELFEQYEQILKLDIK